MQISHPVLVPKIEPGNGRLVMLHTLVMDASDRHEILIKSDDGRLLHETVLRVTHRPRNTIVLASPRDTDDILPKEIKQIIRAARISANLDRDFTLMSDAFFPSDSSCLECFDHVVIQDNRCITDAAAIAALRQWVLAGGRLWVMLDRVDPVVLESLFADEFPVRIIDRVGLTTLRIDKAASASSPRGVIGEQFDYEEPVPLVRVTASTAEVVHTVNGWPASLKKRMNDGCVFVTTLGQRGWVKPGGKTSAQSKEDSDAVDIVPIPMASDFFAEIFDQRGPDSLPKSAIEPQLRDYIGYSIPTWNFVVGTLAGFCLTLVGAGVWLTRSNRLEYLGLIGSLMAVAVGMGLFSVGRMYRHAIPGTIATIQIVEGIPGTDDVQNRGMIGVYRPDGSHSPIRVTRGEEVIPNMEGLESFTRRMVTTDLGVSEWQNVGQPAGLRTTSFRRGETIANRLLARATFNANGLVGTFTGSIPLGTDAIVATSDGRIGVVPKANGAFVASADDVFQSDQFLGSGLISDEQNRRRLIFHELLNNPKKRDYPDRPQLMFWTDQWDHGIQFGPDLKTQGATLVAVPLVFDRPQSGIEFTIPSPLLSYSNRVSPDGTPSPLMWDVRRKEWHERSTPGTSWLRFQVPRELLPLKIARARIDVRVAGPIGRIEVLGLKNGSIASLRSVNDPVGALSIEIEDVEVLSLDVDGAVVLGLACGDPNRPELTGAILDSDPRTGSRPKSQADFSKTDTDKKVNYWRIESLGIQLWARIVEQKGN